MGTLSLQSFQRVDWIAWFVVKFVATTINKFSFPKTSSRAIRKPRLSPLRKSIRDSFRRQRLIKGCGGRYDPVERIGSRTRYTVRGYVRERGNYDKICISARVPGKYFIIAGRARYFHNLAEYSTYRAMKMLFDRWHFSSIIRNFSPSLPLFFFPAFLFIPGHRCAATRRLVWNFCSSRRGSLSPLLNFDRAPLGQRAEIYRGI